VLLDVRRGVRLGVPAEHAAVGVPRPERAPGAGFPPRRLVPRGTPVFELNQWCGTCPALFTKLTQPQAADLGRANMLLQAGLRHIDDRVLQVYAEALPDSTYTALLLQTNPHLMIPGGQGDYFSHEQVATWGPERP
jgi:hypothetical protein